ncbi:putative HTH-type transcriptional regulator YtcD [compost metagenome]
MLSSELKDLEVNQLVKRTVLNTQPISVEYELTEYGYTLKKVIENLADWGVQHRKTIIGKNEVLADN